VDDCSYIVKLQEAGELTNVSILLFSWKFRWCICSYCFISIFSVHLTTDRTSVRIHFLIVGLLRCCLLACDPWWQIISII
jgi:hypothetical protein